MDASTTQEAARLAEVSVGRFIADLSTSAPTPGGGAAAAVIGATASGLLSMVAELSDGRPQLAQYAETISRSAAVGRQYGAEMLRLADRDAAAFTAFMNAWRSSKGLPAEERAMAIGAAASDSAEAPRQILRCCLAVADACKRLAGRSNRNLDSDLICASRAIEAAAQCASENVLVNLPNIKDLVHAATLREETRRMLAGVERDARSCRRVLASPRPRQPERAPAGPSDG